MPCPFDRRKRAAAARGLAGPLIAILVFGFAGAGGAASAEPRLQLAQASPPAGQRGGTPQRQAQPAQPPADPVQAQIADLQKKLAITPAQQPQFDAFAQALRQNSQEMSGLMQQAQQNQKHNAVEDLRASAQFAQTEADGLKRLLPVLEALYGALSDQQKRTADQLFTSAPPDQPPPQQQQRKRQG